MPSALQEQLEQIAIDEFTTELGNRPVSEVFRTGNTEIDSAMADSGVAPKITHSAPTKVTVYSMQDGVSSEILVTMLRKQMQKKLANGNKAFTLRKSEAPVVVNAGLKCYLHAESDMREEAIKAGLGGLVCTKSNLPSAFEQERHMQTTHTNAWKTLERAREQRRENEGRELLQAQTAAMQAMAGQRPALTSAPPTDERKVYSCLDCARFFDSAQGLNLHRTKEHAGVPA
jgi:hypothetical protein